MADKTCSSKIADIPTKRPGFDALDISAPILVQMNPDGKWENSKPENIDEEKLRCIVEHLMKSKAISAAQSYCCQCASEKQKTTGSKDYVPVIMMPIYSANDCPFDMDCEVKKMKEEEVKKPTTKKTKVQQLEKESDKDKDEKKKTKKRGFVMQRLTDFDLLSQW